MSGILHPRLRLACVSAAIDDDLDERASNRLLPRHDELVHATDPDPDEDDDDGASNANAWMRERVARMSH